VRLAAIAALCLPVAVFAQEKAETHELVGHIGSRPALLVLNATQRSDAGWQLSGEYILFPTLLRRFLQGERGPELGVTTLKEGTTPILYGREPTGELRGIWRERAFKGTRYGPGGQEREHFEFSEDFPSMEAYSAKVRCEPVLAYEVDQGKVKSFAWRSQGCALSGLEQQPMQGGLRLESQGCSVTLREVGEAVKIAAEGCSARCGGAPVPEPLVVDRRGSCRLLRAEVR
jgi:hypothetical protein